MWMKNTAEPQPKPTDFPMVEFMCAEANFRQKKKAYQVGEWLLVSYCGNFNRYYKIYRSDTGKPAIGAIFEDAETAVLVASLLEGKYGEYFPIWEDYPLADIFSLAQWSVENGTNINTVIQAAKTGKDLADGLRRTI